MTDSWEAMSLAIVYGLMPTTMSMFGPCSFGARAAMASPITHVFAHQQDNEEPGKSPRSASNLFQFWTTKIIERNLLFQAITTFCQPRPTRKTTHHNKVKMAPLMLSDEAKATMKINLELERMAILFPFF